MLYSSFPLAILHTYVHACSAMSESAIPWTVAHRVPLSMGFSRRAYWSRLPFPTPGDLPDPGVESESLMSAVLAGNFLTTAPPWKPMVVYVCHCYALNLPGRLWSTGRQELDICLAGYGPRVAKSWTRPEQLSTHRYACPESTCQFSTSGFLFLFCKCLI